MANRDVDFGFWQQFEMIVDFAQHFFQLLTLSSSSHSVIADGQPLHLLFFLSFRLIGVAENANVSERY